MICSWDTPNYLQFVSENAGFTATKFTANSMEKMIMNQWICNPEIAAAICFTENNSVDLGPTFLTDSNPAGRCW